MKRCLKIIIAACALVAGVIAVIYKLGKDVSWDD